MGRARSARHIGIVVGARAARAPFVCGVNVGDLLCGTSIASIESIESIKSIESIESVESSDSIESIESIQSIEPIESIALSESIVLLRADFKKMRFSMFGSVILITVLYFLE